MENIDPIEVTAIVFDDWNPRIIGESQEQPVKYIVFQGKAVRPPQVEDELFAVFTGQLVLTSDDRFIVLGPGEFMLVSKAVEYRVIALDEAHVLIYSKHS